MESDLRVAFGQSVTFPLLSPISLPATISAHSQSEPLQVYVKQHSLFTHEPIHQSSNGVPLRDP